MTTVAASSIGADQFSAVVFDPDTDQCLARAREHVTGDYIDLQVGTQTLTIAPHEVPAAVELLASYARAREQRLHDGAEKALARALDRVGEQR